MRAQSLPLHRQEADRREEILAAARTLFARHGFHKVSLRDIAGELGMSVGNLTYYYPRKTDLMDAVLSDFRRSVLPGGRPPRDVLELHEFLGQQEALMDSDAFAFPPCCREEASGPTARFQAQMVRDLDLLWTDILTGLTEGGWLTPPEYPGQHQALSAAIQLTFRHWAAFRRDEAAAGHAPSFQACIWAILYPNLTDAGRQIARKLS